MNKRTSVILLGAAVLLLSVLFPPWLYKCDWQSFSAGYHFFLRPPMMEVRCLNSEPSPGPLATVQMNKNRLVFQSIVVAVLTAGVLLFLRTKRTNLSMVTAFLISCIGVVGLMLLGLTIHFEK